MNNLLLLTQYIPHGHCYLWQKPLVWLHVVSDFFIAAAYFSISLILLRFIRQRQDNPFNQTIVLFSWFIFSCGITHLLSVWTLWHPDYWLSGTAKAITALISVYTVVKLIEFFPFALNLPDPQVLEQANQDLAKEVAFREQIETELEQERSFLRTMLNSFSDGVVACDEKGVLAIFNLASQKIFGRQKALKSQEWSEHYHLYYPDGKTLLKSEDTPLSKAFAGETFTDLEIVTIPEGSSPIILWVNGCPILDLKGNKLGAVVTVRNVTESKKTEKQLMKLNTELLQSNQELEQFAYVASHDLREPLRMVTSFTQLLAQRYGKQLDDEADTIIGFAVDGAKRMEVLIEDLLLFSRLGKEGKKMKIVNCNLIVEKALSNLGILVQESNAQITIAPLPNIIGDHIQLVQLFQNLITNALIYCNGQPQISISAVSQHPGWLFSVRDNGIGINSSSFKRIFEVFQRLHPKEKYSGTGIGLAICKKIVERHGGDIWVESELGQGSDFKFTLNSKIIGNI